VTVEVRLLSGAGCRLCDEARRVLRAAEGPLGYRLVEETIDGDPALEAAHRHELPVVLVGGRKAFRLRVDPVELARRVAAAERAPER
jgi:hypothetical protein